MKTIVRTIISLSVIAMIAAACGGGDNIEAKKGKLEKLKAQQADIADQIKTLEQEIASSGDTTKTNEKMKDVAVMKLEPQPFHHSIDVQGRVEGDENVTLTAKMAGSIVRVNAVAGSEVRAGQVIAEIENDVMKAQLADMKTSYELVKDVYEKQKSLWDQKIGTEMQYLQAKTNKESLEQKIRQMNESLEMYYIKAPFSGTVDEMLIKLGQTVAPGMPAARVVNFNKLKVRADLAESYATQVKTGDVVNIVFPDINKSVTSKVSYNGKVINPLTRTFNVEIELPSSTDYRPNMVARVSIVDYTNKEALVVPVNTVQHIDDKDFVFVASMENGVHVARKREVKVGQTYSSNAEIMSGLHAGDMLISTGFGNLNDGELIKF